VFFAFLHFFHTPYRITPEKLSIGLLVIANFFTAKRYYEKDEIYAGLANFAENGSLIINAAV